MAIPGSGDVVLLYGVDSNGNPVPLRLNSDGTLDVHDPAGVELGSTPTTQALGDAASAGASVKAAPELHKHGMPSFGGAGAAVGTAAAGVATTPSRSDHVHNIADQTVTSRMVTLTDSTAEVAAGQTTTSTSYTDLATTGPAITLTPGVTQAHLLLYICLSSNNTVNAVRMSPAIAGAAAVDADSCRGAWSNVSQVSCSMSGLVLALAQSSGATHTLKYKAEAQTGTFTARRIVGMAI